MGIQGSRAGGAGSEHGGRSRGLVAALATYLTWGALFPIYFKTLSAVPPLEILAHRIVWSTTFLALLVTAQRRWGDLVTGLRARRIAIYAATGLLISGNWLTFIWAVTSGRVLEASLGYFINPLVTVLLGAVFLGERISRRQSLAVALAAAGVLTLVARQGSFPLVALALAGTFSTYSLLRKKFRIDAVVGLLVETALVAPIAVLYLAYLAARGHASFGSAGTPTSALLVTAGVITAIPLIWFAVAVRSLRLSTMGLLQYVGPTCQLLLAVAVYREHFTRAHVVAFTCIWVSLALYTFDALRSRRPVAAESLALD
jgi:chloramphenicol-sensitive protein RarD